MKKTIYLLLTIIYIAAIYGTSGIMRPILDYLKNSLGDNFDYGINLFLGIIAICLLYGIKNVASHIKVREIVILSIIIAGYLFIMKIITVPEERFHLLQYGVLVWFVSAYKNFTLKNYDLCFFSFLFCCFVGTGDEVVQWLRPNRVGDFRDILINWAAILLAQGVVYLIFILKKDKAVIK